MSVGVCYPSMYDLRLAVRQHAIMNEFELDTAHSDTSRFRGNCASLGCPWIIRAKTQHDGSVRVLVYAFFVALYCMYVFYGCLLIFVCLCICRSK
jgi:hypothetical protein